MKTSLTEYVYNGILILASSLFIVIITICFYTFLVAIIPILLLSLITINVTTKFNSLLIKQGYKYLKPEVVNYQNVPDHLTLKHKKAKGVKVKDLH